ncbi:MAG: hypothetical protein U9Q12_00745 [Patescibacteria group bacterium]|nr:hypothetical protein [Patescibacteria group bacterium]
MKKNTVVNLALALVIGFIATGCAQPMGQQFGLRGYPNAPHQRVQPLVVDQNAIYSMTPQQFNEYRKRVDWATSYNSRLIRNDQQAANAAKNWTNGGNNYFRGNTGFGNGQVTNSAMRTFSSQLSQSINQGIRDLFK